MKNILIVLVIFGLVGCTSGEDQVVDTGTGDAEVLCEWDSDESATAATALTFGTEESGFLCPLGDADWYSFSTGAGDDLVTVSLVVDGPVSPIDPSYKIMDATGQNIVAAPDGADAAGPDDTLVVTHAIGAGDYRVVVQDRGFDAQDTRHRYLLTVSSTAEPDGNEPNNDAGTATTVSGGSVEGYISFGGDEDWYEFTTAADYMVRATFTMEMGAIQPMMRVVDADGNILGELANFDGSREATDMELMQALEAAGTYYLVVSDDNLAQTDVDVSYSIAFEFIQDPDHANEPNDHPSAATVLNAGTCGGSWSTASRVAYIGSQGDVDWYRLPLSGCNRGVIEVELTRGGTVPENFNFTTRLVRGVPGETCVLDQDCQTLTSNGIGSSGCSEHMHCTRVGNTCLPEGKCGGAGLCLPGGAPECGAVLLSETAHPSNPDVLKMSAPLMGETEIYIAVSDQGGNAYDLVNSYTLTARVIADPDSREDASVYTAGSAAYDDDIGAHQSDATYIQVHNARSGSICAGGGAWVSGYLSYQYDQDWFWFDHPCPGGAPVDTDSSTDSDSDSDSDTGQASGDCMVDVYWRFEGSGPTEFMIHRYHGGSLFGDNISSAIDSTDPTAMNGPETGVFGNGAECSFAWEDHSGPYHLMVRDTRATSGNETGGFWEWSTTQRYSVCVEVVDDGCLDPCCMYGNGCGAPQGGSCP